MKASWWMGLGVALLLGGARAETVAEYGEQCAAQVTPVPAFNCMAGEVIPITVDGQVPERYTPDMRCDKPSLLPAREDGAQGQCLPGTRALVLRDDATAQISAICRKKVVRDVEDPLFDEINVIAHNLKTGKTCWFTAKAAEPLRADRGIDGRVVPSPAASRREPPRHAVGSAPPAQLPVPPAEKVWLSPKAVATSKPACMQCHDSGPFMYSPYIAQTTQLPGDPFGRFLPKAVGRDFKQAWADLSAYGITTRGNTCTTCHRMGHMDSCRVTTLQATGRASQDGADAWAQRFPQSHWMSPGNLHSRAQWDQAFAESLRRIADCCDNPQGAGCLRVDYR